MYLSKLTILNEQTEDKRLFPLRFEFFFSHSCVSCHLFSPFYLIPAMHFGKMRTPPSFSFWSIAKMTRELISLTNIFLRDAEGVTAEYPATRSRTS